VYKACPEKTETENKESDQKEMKKPEPTVHEVGSEFIGELHWL
jgi:hypothetical protein